MIQILTACLVLGVLGLLFGGALGAAGIWFYVEGDHRAERLLQMLPGVNCGGCGFTGCLQLAFAMLDGKADADACLACPPKQNKKIAEFLGVAAPGGQAKRMAMVLCGGTHEVMLNKYRYAGASDCLVAAQLGGGPKQCGHACLGLGSCVNICKFDAICICDGIAVVDQEKCTACGMCAKICPQQIIVIMPNNAPVLVRCSNTESVRKVRAVCGVGCIGCKVCMRVCESGAINVEEHLAKIDYAMCSGCGKCAQKCPAGCILMRYGWENEERENVNGVEVSAF